MKHRILYLFLFGFLSSISEAQILTRTFAKRYGGSKSEGSGSPLIPSTAGYGGQILSDTRPDSTSFLVANSFSINYFVHGNYGDADIWVAKLKRNGDTLWTRKFGSTAEDDPFQIRALSDGGCVFTGHYGAANNDFAGSGSLAAGQSAFLIRLDSLGHVVFKKQLGGKKEDRLYGVIQTRDKGFLLCGYSASNDGTLATAIDTTGGAWLVKTDSAGSVQWNTHIACKDTLPTTRREMFWKVTELPNDSGYMVGGTASYKYSQVGNDDFFLARFNTNGQLTWKKKWGGIKDDFLSALVGTSSGKIFITGIKENVSGSSNDFGMYCLNLSGDILWQTLVQGSLRFYPNDLNIDEKGRIQLCGALFNFGSSSFPTGYGDYDGWFAILDSNGTILAQILGGGGNDDRWYGINYLPAKKEVVLSGRTTSPQNPWCNQPAFNTQLDADAWLVRIKITDTATVGTQTLTTDQGMLLYPQPASSSFSILFHVLPQEAVLVDVRGRVVRRYTSEALQTNLYEVAGLAPGLYTLYLHMATGPVYKRVVVE